MRQPRSQQFINLVCMGTERIAEKDPFLALNYAPTPGPSFKSFKHVSQTL